MRIRKILVGINTKLYYYRLFENLSSRSFGLDAGIAYSPFYGLTLAFTVRDFLSKYKWDTSDLYGQSGNSTTETFPVLRTLGLAYTFNEQKITLSAEVEQSSFSTTNFRVGGEWTAAEFLSLQAGIDGWNFQDRESAHPSFGFSLYSGFTEYFLPSLHYAYISEPYNVFSRHVLTLSLTP
jgi:hypothetical protein